MPDSERTRTVYGQTGVVTPLWVWVLQRGTGLLLGPLVLAHIALPGGPFMAWLGTLLLLTVLAHAGIGIWRLAGMRGLGEAARAAGYVGMSVLLVVLAVLGAGVVVSLIR